MEKKIFRGLIYSVILAGVLIFLLGFYADFSNFLKAVLRFKPSTLFLVAALSFLNYLTRFARWNYYLNKAKIQVEFKVSFYTFFSGLLMSVTPGKAGEILKSLILKDTREVPIAKSAPVVFAERLTDLLAVIVLAACFSFSFKVDYRIILAGLFLVVVSAGIFMSDRSLNFFKKVFSLHERLEKFIESLHELFLGVRRLLGALPLLFGTFFGILAWLFEALGFYFLLLTFFSNYNFFLAVFTYTISTLAGAISMLPGGLVFTEATMSGILMATGLKKAEAIATTVVIRGLTLWFGAFVGLLTFTLAKKIMKIS